MPTVRAAKFFRRAVALARSVRQARQLVVDHQVSAATLLRWAAHDQLDRGERLGLASPEPVEIAWARM
jgi:transposase